jgi:hypothetical protein
MYVSFSSILLAAAQFQVCLWTFLPWFVIPASVEPRLLFLLLSFTRSVILGSRLDRIDASALSASLEILGVSPFAPRPSSKLASIRQTLQFAGLVRKQKRR